MCFSYLLYVSIDAPRMRDAMAGGFGLWGMDTGCVAGCITGVVSGLVVW